MTDLGLTNEFLEAFLKEPVDKFEVWSGSNLGDGYTCTLSSVDVWRKSNPKPVHLLFKCFPTNPDRQELLYEVVSFQTELEAYTKIFPALREFQKELESEVISPPVPPFYFGQYIPPEERKKLGRPIKPLDNCIVMANLREKSNGGFRLRDRFLGLDLDHYKLVIEAQAKFHALSWAYKCKRGIDNFDIQPINSSGFLTFLESCFKTSFAAAKEILKGNTVGLNALDHLESVKESVCGLYFGSDSGPSGRGHSKDNILKKPGLVVWSEEPWNVLLHGDCWSNNMMFRYDEKTNRPVEVVFLDFQLCRQGDPFCDVSYTLYSSGGPNLRPKHLESMLHVYYDTFTDICRTLQVPPLPAWSWEEVNRRFHRAKIFGGIHVVMFLPIMLKNVDELVNLDESADLIEREGLPVDGVKNFSKLISQMSATEKSNPPLEYRMKEVMEDLSNDGIL
ncbi:unnamed protein product [Allacma fusca]|uniref:CHK kinase-like domain-containing protein n=1 Tax=Allacma fusca TaxID=39272 RepID=A0A8J2NXP7_9HEXA|nr:unnamed protein product [Allacma fusca]